MADNDRLPGTAFTGHTRWRGEGVVIALWLAAGLAAQVASYRAIEGAPTGRDRLVVAVGLAVAAAATTIAVAGGLAGWWRARADAAPLRRLLVVALVVAAQTAWYVAEIVDRGVQRTDDPVWVALPLLHVAIAALAGGVVLTGVRLVLALAQDGGAGRRTSPRRRRDQS